MVKQTAHRGPQGTDVADGQTARPVQTLPHLPLREAEHEVIGPQARNVDVRVKTLQRVVELVGQKHRLQPALVEHLLRPIGAPHPFRRG